jgi:hypothetical protein
LHSIFPVLITDTEQIWDIRLLSLENAAIWMLSVHRSQLKEWEMPKYVDFGPVSSIGGVSKAGSPLETQKIQKIASSSGGIFKFNEERCDSFVV